MASTLLGIKLLLFWYIVSLFALSVFYWLVGLTQITSIGLAQELPYLRVKQTALQPIRQLEIRAIKTYDSLLLAEAWYQYGKEYERVGNNEWAEPYFLKARYFFESRRDSTRLLPVYFRLSELEQRQNHLPEALNYARRALHLSQTIQSASGLVEGYPAPTFYRLSRSLIINLNYLKRLSQNHLYLADHTTPI